MGMDKTLSIAKSYLWTLVKFDNLNFVSAIIKMFQHINMGMDKTLSIAKSLMWPNREGVKKNGQADRKGCPPPPLSQLKGYI